MSPTRTRWLVVAISIGMFLWFFRGVLFQDRAFGFRDAANYYYPLFAWECSEWHAGRIPQWNPFDNAGTPVLADATSSVLYPGKLVFTLPVSFRLRYHIYVTSHVLLAAAGAYGLARAWNVSVTGAGLAALTYAFGGTVISQTCNVVFLVGAAWFPLALLAADRMRSSANPGWAVMLGAVLALMTLGGDPQASYQSGLLAAIYVWFAGPTTAANPIDGSSRWLRTRLGLLVIAAASGFALAAVQIVPSVDWALSSDRVAAEQPHSIYDAVAQVAGGRTTWPEVNQGLFGDPPAGTHLANAYEFSVGPWHTAELFWPNCFGRNVPQNERWITALPGEDRAWSPSMYLGLLPVLLAFCSWRLTGGAPTSRFAKWLVVIGLCGSFGRFGIGWLLNEVYLSTVGGDAAQLAVGKPVGGLYWFLVVFLPGYAYFRYPAKLLVVAALGISLLAAQGWDRAQQGDSQRMLGAARLLMILSATLAALLWIGLPFWRQWLQQAPTDALFGPVQVPAATQGVFRSLLHTFCGAAACIWLLRRLRPVRTHADASSVGSIALLLTALDLSLANDWLAMTIDGNILRHPQGLAAEIHADATKHDVSPRFYRSPIADFVPREWSTSSSSSRLDDVVRWEQELLLPTHHLSGSVPLAAAHTTLNSRDWQAMLRVARDSAARESHNKDRFEHFESLAVAYFGMPDTTSVDGYERVSVDAPTNLTLWRNPRAYPRAWLVHQVEYLEPLRTNYPDALLERTRQVLMTGGQPRDLRSVAIIESAETPHALQGGAPQVANGRCQIVHDDPQRVEIKVKLHQPGYLVLADSFHLGWRADRFTDGNRTPLTIDRANRVFRAVYLPPGEHTVVFRYRPRLFYLAALLSVSCWLLLTIGGLRHLRNTRHCVTKPNPG